MSLENSFISFSSRRSTHYRFRGVFSGQQLENLDYSVSKTSSQIRIDGFSFVKDEVIYVYYTDERLRHFGCVKWVDRTCTNCTEQEKDMIYGLKEMMLSALSTVKC